MDQAQSECTVAEWEMLKRLDKDLRFASRTLNRDEARFLTKMYYLTQEHRVQYASQARSSEESGESHVLNKWFFQAIQTLENDLKRALGEFASEYHIGRWLQSITGIGPVISAGILAHLDIRMAPTCGHFWRFAGLDPTQKWHGKSGAAELVGRYIPARGKPTVDALAKIAAEMNVHETWFNGKLDKGTRAEVIKLVARRPWNTQLKTLLVFHAGECFIRTKSNKNQYYGTLFDQRKQLELERNERGDNKDQAAKALEEKNYDKSTEAYKAYSSGMLPAAQINARARRWTVKIFISHIHHAMHVDYTGQNPPNPYSFEKCNGDHRHFIELPNWPFEEGGAPLRDLFTLER